MSTNNRVSSQPRQKLPYSSKNRKWRIENVDFAENFSLYNSESVRRTIQEKIINMNLCNGIVDYKDMARVVNPSSQDASYIPKKMPHHPIMVSKIDLLVGEEIKRIFDPTAIVVNQDAISDKETALKNELNERIVTILQSKLSEGEFEAKLEELQDYFEYEWQDLRESMANRIIKHYSKAQNFPRIFNDCFRDSLEFGEEIIQVEIVGGEPTLTKLNPMKVHTVRSGNSTRIEDSNIIILEDHWSPGKIVDYFHEDLKNKDLESILEYNNKTKSTTDNYSDDYNHVLLRDHLTSSGEPLVDDILGIAEINGHSFSSNMTDASGNIRVLRIYWRSLKKVQKVKYYDEFGETLYKTRTEEYIPNEVMGEESKTMWVNEWWEGTKIGKDVYIKMKPCDMQFNKVDIPSYGHPGIIGQIYSNNQGKAVSLVSRMKNYQYLYDVVWDRLNKAMATDHGKIFELDLAKVPQGWEIDKWMYYAVVNKIAVVNSFNEGTKGASTGKLAGGMNAMGGRSIDMSLGDYIQQHINILEFIKGELGEIAGVTKQREGQISHRETLGGVERSVNQSANITEFWFDIHEDFKVRAYRAFLECAKVALKGNNKKVQYILDDMSIELLNIDGDFFSEADYDIVITNSRKSKELEQMIKELSQAFITNGGKISTVIDIHLSEGIGEMRRKIEIAERRQDEAEAETNKINQEMHQQEMEAEAMRFESDQALKDLINQRDNETKLLIKQMEIESSHLKDLNSDDGIVDPIAEGRLNLDKKISSDERLLKIKELNNKMKMHNDTINLKEKEIKYAKQNKAK